MAVWPYERIGLAAAAHRYTFGEDGAVQHEGCRSSPSAFYQPCARCRELQPLLITFVMKVHPRGAIGRRAEAIYIVNPCFLRSQQASKIVVERVYRRSVSHGPLKIE